MLRTWRTLPSSCNAVYDAFATPDVLASWWGPDGFTNSFEVFEFQVGGRRKFTMHGPDGKNYPNESVFAALEPGARPGGPVRGFLLARIGAAHRLI